MRGRLGRCAADAHHGCRYRVALERFPLRPTRRTSHHADEKAEPGSYQVKLGNGVQVALAAATRMGAATITFPAGKAARILVRTSDSEVGSTAAHTQIDRAARSRHRLGDEWQLLRLYRHGGSSPLLHALLRGPVRPAHYRDRGMEGHEPVTPGGIASEGGTGFGPKGFPEAGHGSGVWVGFGDGWRGAACASASPTSARRMPAPTSRPRSTAARRTKQVAARARAAWNKRLSQIEIEGGTDEQRRVFTTALYHAQHDAHYLQRRQRRVHRHGPQGPSRRCPVSRVQYANFSGWDVYRSQFQLLTWLDPKRGSDIAQSLYNQSQQDHGRWDRWTHLSGATHVMNGDPAAAAVADIWAFGGRAFEARGALQSLVHAADVPTKEDLSHDGCPVECVGQRPGLDQWLKLHYIPVGGARMGTGCGHARGCLGRVRHLCARRPPRRDPVQHRFPERAQYWKNIWNPNAAPDGGYFMNRNADGSWPKVRGRQRQSPARFHSVDRDGFVEGSAAQYVWMVPFNVAGLFEQMGGRDKAVARLDRFFYDEKGAPAVTKAGPLHAELDNEPSIETPWLYDFAGQPWKTQQLVRQVLNTIWKNAPNGIPGQRRPGRDVVLGRLRHDGFLP